MTDNPTTPQQQKRPNLARRPRLNQDWPIVIYSFDCWPLEKPPQALWDTAWQMRRLWNELVAMFTRARELDRHDERGKPLLSKEERAAVYYPFKQRKTTRSEKHEKLAARYDLAAQLWGGNAPSLHAIGAQYLNVIPSACYEAVIARFIVTFKEWQKAPKLKGAPAFKTGPLDRVSVPLIYNAGITADDLSANSKLSAHLHNTLALRHERTPEGAKLPEYLHNGWFDVGCERARLPLHVAFNRPFPDRARIKQVALVGQRSEVLGWRWSLQVRFEYPPDAPRLHFNHQGQTVARPAYTARKATGRVAGLDLGWRMRDGYLRIGYLCDNGGNRYEFMVPLESGNRATRKHNRRTAKKGFAPRFNEWLQLDAAQRKLDEDLENCKARVRELAAQLSDTPAPLASFLQHYHKARNTSLRKLLKGLQEVEAAPEIVAVLAEWDTQSRLLWRRWAGAQHQAVQTRNSHYREISYWLAANFDVVAWEGDLSLKEIAEDYTADPTLRNAAGWRVVASLSTLRPYVQQAFAKLRRELQGEPAAYSSELCARCDAPMVTHARKRVRVCENGHQCDQDENASSWFLSRIAGAASTSLPPVEIPPELQRYVRVLDPSEL